MLTQSMNVNGDSNQNIDCPLSSLDTSWAVNSFLASIDVSGLLIFANILDPHSNQQNFGPDLDPNRHSDSIPERIYSDSVPEQIF